MIKLAECADIVVVTDGDGQSFRCMVANVQSEGKPDSAIQISTSGANTLSTRGSLLIGKWLPYDPSGQPGTWRWPS